jgi:hypothetical protein
MTEYQRLRPSFVLLHVTLGLLLPRTLRLGAAGLVLSCAIALVVHLSMGQWRGDLLLYIVALVFVAAHGPAYRAAPHRLSAA